MTHKLSHTTIHQKTSGFTVVELLISTVVFSIILLILSFSVIAITRTYYKGIVQSETQNTTRTVSSDVAQAIQFGGGAPASGAITASTGVVCMGTQGYAYTEGVKLVNATTPVLRAYTFAGSSSCDVSSLGATTTTYNTINANGKELLSPHMRLAWFSVKLAQLSFVDQYQIIVRIVYGDNDLLCSPSAGNCNNNTILANFAVKDLACKSFTGSQFCAESDLNTVVQRRIIGLQLSGAGA